MTDGQDSLVQIDASGVYYRDLNTRLREVTSNGTRRIELTNVHGQRYIGTDQHPWETLIKAAQAVGMRDHYPFRDSGGTTRERQFAEVLLRIYLNLWGDRFILIQKRSEIVCIFGKLDAYRFDIITVCGGDNDVLKITLFFNPKHEIQVLFLADDDLAV